MFYMFSIPGQALIPSFQWKRHNMCRVQEDPLRCLLHRSNGTNKTNLGEPMHRRKGSEGCLSPCPIYFFWPWRQSIIPNSAENGGSSRKQACTWPHVHHQLDNIDNMWHLAIYRRIGHVWWVGFRPIDALAVSAHITCLVTIGMTKWCVPAIMPRLRNIEARPIPIPQEQTQNSSFSVLPCVCGAWQAQVLGSRE